jgi:hypothetical protein
VIAGAVLTNFLAGCEHHRVELYSIEPFNSPSGVSRSKREKESIFPASFTRWLDPFPRISGS